MWWYDDGWGWGGWLVMTLGMVAFWGLVFWAIVTVVRSSATPGDREPAGGRTPDQILSERFARGEIDEEEYRRRLDVLHGTGSGSRGLVDHG